MGSVQAAEFDRPGAEVLTKRQDELDGAAADPR
jgi:hypothetical protein